MFTSLIIAVYFNFVSTVFEDWQKILFGSILTTIIWLVATFITPPDDKQTLLNFVKKVNPGGPGWKKFQDLESKEKWPVPQGIIAMLLGCITVYGILLGVGQLIYGQTLSGLSLLAVGGMAALRLKIKYKL